jgi:dipeptidyl-peptidase 4
MFPYAAHGYGNASNYMMCRRWDYFVTWLLDMQPPKEYEFRATPGGRGGGPG